MRVRSLCALGLRPVAHLMMPSAVPASEQSIADAADALSQGRLVALPTETVYGLGADGLSARAVARIFAAKGRPSDHPLILHVGSVAEAKKLAAHWPPSADRLADAFWPGPMTLILKRAECVPDAVTGGQDTVGIRVPSHPVALALLKAFATVGSGVIAAPSANRFGGVSPTRASDVSHGLGGFLEPGDMILDGGSCEVGVESTIVDLSGESPRILRPGGLSREDIERTLQSVESAAVRPSGSAQVAVPRVSGSLESHYAPRAPVHLVTPDQILSVANEMLAQHPGMRIALMPFAGQGFDVSGHDPRLTISRMPDAPQAYAQNLYAAMNDLDRLGLDAILIARPPQTAAWEAVLDRLRRAATRLDDSATVGK